MVLIFINQSEDPEAEQEISGMPGIYRFGVNRLENHLKSAVAAGLSSVLLFGVPFSMPKDEFGSAADHPENPVILAIKKLRGLFPNLLIACDVSSNGKRLYSKSKKVFLIDFTILYILNIVDLNLLND